jgi:hypothetical protein
MYTIIADFSTFHTFSQSAFTRRFLVTDLNNKNYSVSVPMSFLSGEYPATEPSQPAYSPRCVSLGRTQQKTQPSTVPLLPLWAVA